MKLPVLPPQVVHPGEDLYAIHERPPVVPARRVAERTVPPMIVPAHHEQAGEGHDGEQATQDRQEAVGETPYAGPDRRMGERRLENRPIMLDTRSGHDRRHDGDQVSCPIEVDVEV